MKLHDASYRYNSDATFRQVVDVMKQILIDLHVSPGELRDAAVLASLQVEAKTVRSMTILGDSELADIFALKGQGGT